MGGCFSSKSETDHARHLAKELEFVIHTLEETSKTHLEAIEENKRLRREIVKLQMKIENYGFVMSGCGACGSGPHNRMTPTASQVSKRLGYTTVP